VAGLVIEIRQYRQHHRRKAQGTSQGAAAPSAEATAIG
jgi:hypothetical protein